MCHRWYKRTISWRTRRSGKERTSLLNFLFGWDEKGAFDLDEEEAAEKSWGLNGYPIQ